jgi:hypothetical protein
MRRCFRSLAIAGAFASAIVADAQAVPPDYGLYCKTRHPGSETGSVIGAGISNCVVREAGQLKFRDIDIAIACELTTGSASYRYLPKGYIDCPEGNQGNPHTLSDAEWARHCATVENPAMPAAAFKMLMEAAVVKCSNGRFGYPGEACFKMHGTRSFRYTFAQGQARVVCLK